MTESKIRTRLRVLAGLVVFMFAALTVRLWFLQVLASPELKQLANENQLRLVPIEPLRGEILDRDGDVLVTNRPSTVITIDRLAMNGKEEEVLYRLSELLHVPVEQLVERLNSRRYLPYEPVPVAEDVSKEVVFYVREHQDEFPGVGYELAAVREYAQGALAAHVLGYVGEISNPQLKQRRFQGYRPGEVVGKEGVEASYERDLYGENGTRAIQVNAQGNVLDAEFREKQPVPGNDVVLSLDTGTQELAERSLALGIALARRTLDPTTDRYFLATGGAAIVMDPRSGEVLALASNPSFDPSLFVGGLTQKEADSLFADPRQPLFNRATQGLYPPGSTFKPFVAWAALKRGFASIDGYYSCPAKYAAPGDTSGEEFRNWNPVDQGYMTLHEALVVSCDTVFYQFGWDYWVRYYHGGRSSQSEYMQKDLRRFGFGRRTGIDVPGEQPGVMPTERYKHSLYRKYPKVFGKYYGWLPGDYINMSIGQGYLQVTPMQLAVAYSALANGGRLWRPRIGLRVETPDGNLVRTIKRRSTGRVSISREQLGYIRAALADVPVSGTAAPAFAGFPLDRVPVAGKTGTADIAGHQAYSWFAAMAPADAPRYVVVAMVEQGGHGATTAAPVVRRILEGLFGLGASKRLKAGTLAD